MSKVKPRFLVLGHKGFLGSHMINYIPKKYEVVMIDKDLRIYENVLEAMKGVDYVFHFAANMGGIGFFSEQNYYPVVDNYTIDMNVLRACEANKVKRLFYPSSACAYPLYAMGVGIPLSEEMSDWTAYPDQMYGWEKLSMIKLLRNAPFEVRVGVLHTIYGPGQEYEGKKAKFPPQMAYKALQAVKTGKIEIWGDGEQTRTFMYVDDAIAAMYEVMMSKNYWGEVNIGSDQEISVNQIVALCCLLLKIKPKLIYDTSKPVGPRRRLCDNTKFNKHYKSRPQTDLKKGFRNIINYIKKHE